MKNPGNDLSVWMNGYEVGRLRKHANGALSFGYHPDWLAMDEARPVSLSLPLSSREYSGDVVYNFFDNLLPDNANIRARIQRKFNASTSHAFDLLSSIGMDCVGAIQLGHPDTPLADVRHIEGESLNSRQIANLLRDYGNRPLGMDDVHEDFRISIAGAQEKTALLKHNGQWLLPTGPTPTSHIFKLPIGVIDYNQIDLSDSCENEWLCLEIARGFGLNTCNAEVTKFEDVKCLVVERFDRRYSRDGNWLMRLPQEDMCQAMGIAPANKYESDGGPGIAAIMEMLNQSANQQQDREDFYKAIVLFVLLAATDGHGKNFSLFIKPAGRWRLTPLYDIMSVHPLIANGQLEARKAKMAMAMLGKNRHYLHNEILGRHLLETAKQAKFSTGRARQIIKAMFEQLDSVIDQVSTHLPATFPRAIADSIFTGMQRQRDRLSRTM